MTPTSNTRLATLMVACLLGFACEKPAQLSKAPVSSPIAQPGSNSSPSLSSSPTPQAQILEPDQEESELAIRFEYLDARGKGKEILSGFSRDQLVREATTLFPYAVSYQNLSLHSDKWFSEKEGREILMSVHKKLVASPIFDPAQKHRAFICQQEWTEEFFLQGAGRLGGLCYFPVANHVFLTKADIEKNALLSPRGRPIAAPRTLDYYIAHEFTHTLVGHYLGKNGFDELPNWLSEGYPDFVGLGPSFTLDRAQKAYKNRDPRVKGTLAEDYMRYDVMTAYYLEKRKRKIEELLKSCPTEKQAAGASFGE